MRNLADACCSLSPLFKEKNAMTKTAGFPREAVSPLLYWYDSEARDLPWRREPTPYRIWISEIMLQQTRVSAVIPYYLRFLGRFPDPFALSCAEEDALRKTWEGLGYYSRVRNLQRAARILVDSYGGELPADRDELIRLPGIGPYTAGAIASIAFGLPEPAVDGNVLRLYARVTADSSDLSAPKIRSRITEDLRGLYRDYPEDASRLTQSLMELGAVVCLPNGTPLCGNCPMRPFCRGCREGNPSRYPSRREKKERRKEEKTILVLRSQGRIALRKRPESGLLAGLWELPAEDGVLSPEQITDRVRNMGGVLSGPPVCCGEATHVFTHVEWHMTGWAADLAVPCPDLTFADPAEIRERYCIPSAFQPFLNGKARG